MGYSNSKRLQFSVGPLRTARFLKPEPLQAMPANFVKFRHCNEDGVLLIQKSGDLNHDAQVASGLCLMTALARNEIRHCHSGKFETTICLVYTWKQTRSVKLRSHMEYTQSGLELDSEHHSNLRDVSRVLQTGL